jgi:hypothetical protein
MPAKKIIGYSWQDAHNPSPASQGWGWEVAWVRNPSYYTAKTRSYDRVYPETFPARYNWCYCRLVGCAPCTRSPILIFYPAYSRSSHPQLPSDDTNAPPWQQRVQSLALSTVPSSPLPRTPRMVRTAATLRTPLSGAGTPRRLSGV